MASFPNLSFAPLILATILFVSLPNSAEANTEKAAVTPVNVSGDTIGVKGYDPVAYFTLGQPFPGLDQYTYRWQGVTYRFASAANLARFKADPQSYLPQYGGYCAYAMSIDRIADIDPSRWAIVAGKLYLNNNYLSYKLWSLDKSGNIVSANRYWQLYPKKPVGK